jgi:peptidoglycan/LPS O-acetylase OafA/YrhL
LPSTQKIDLPETARLSACSSTCLDALRALAALSVTLSHIRGLLFVEYRLIHPASLTLLAKAVYLITRIGHQSVTVLFVLSGFFISSSILRKLRNGSWSWADYGIDRGARLYTVLIPGLVLGWIWDTIGARIFNSSGYYSSATEPFGTRIPANGLSLLDFAGNLAFLQTRFVPPLGSNGALWSLFNEFWYYALFPSILLAFIYTFQSRRAPAIASLALAGLSCWILQGALIGFLVWLLGCVVSIAAPRINLVSKGKHRIVFPYIAVSGTAFGFCLEYCSDALIGISFATLILGILQLQNTPNSRLANLSRSFAGFSYSLYVLHFPLLFLTRAIVAPQNRWQPDGPHLLYGACIAAGLLSYSFLISRITEANTTKIRTLVRNLPIRPLRRLEVGAPS